MASAVITCEVLCNAGSIPQINIFVNNPSEKGLKITAC